MIADEAMCGCYLFKPLLVWPSATSYFNSGFTFTEDEGVRSDKATSANVSADRRIGIDLFTHFPVFWMRWKGRKVSPWVDGNER
ncbi:hypothetical protein RUM43_007871 [Polyplax serrata]|uniref:Uncharacterized protein n=1 Tax=Polyplax serrata TaxID=468196 RepID=A0AAN8Q6J3_POLSC